MHKERQEKIKFDAYLIEIENGYKESFKRVEDENAKLNKGTILPKFKSLLNKNCMCLFIFFNDI